MNALKIIIIIFIVNFISQFRYIRIAIDYISVFLHEVAHYIVALLFFAKPNFPKIKVIEDNYLLTTSGNVVTNASTSANIFPIAFAPFLNSLLIIFCYYSYIEVYNSFWLDILYMVLTYPIYKSGYPSIDDVVVVLKNPFSVFLYTLFVFAIIYIAQNSMVREVILIKRFY